MQIDWSDEFLDGLAGGPKVEKLRHKKSPNAKKLARLMRETKEEADYQKRQLVHESYIPLPAGVQNDERYVLGIRYNVLSHRMHMEFYFSTPTAPNIHQGRFMFPLNGSYDSWAGADDSKKPEVLLEDKLVSNILIDLRHQLFHRFTIGIPPCISTSTISEREFSKGYNLAVRASYVNTLRVSSGIVSEYEQSFLRGKIKRTDYNAPWPMGFDRIVVYVPMPTTAERMPRYMHSNPIARMQLLLSSNKQLHSDIAEMLVPEAIEVLNTLLEK